MLPHQFRRLMELLRGHFTEVHEAINKQTEATSKEQAANREEIRDVTGILGRVFQAVQSKDQKGDATYNQTYRQQERLISSQVWLVRWAALAFFAAFVYGLVALWQGILMHRTYTEMQNQTKAARDAAYASCLSAQAAQNTFLQVQKDAADSHAVALGTVKQTVADIETERAIMILNPTFPTPPVETLSDQLVIPFTMKNDGKSEAFTVNAWYKATLVTEKDILRISDRNADAMEGKYIPAGAELPGKPSDPTFKPITETMKVWDAKDQAVPRSSQGAAEFLNRSPDYMVMVYGQLKYSDFSGWHELRFCEPVYSMRFGTTHHVTQNEKTCWNYTRQDNQYTAMPKIGTYSAVDINQVPPINCVKPSE